jgi:hypothetical protein
MTDKRFLLAREWLVLFGKIRRILRDFQILEDTNNDVKGAFYQIAKQPPI